MLRHNLRRRRAWGKISQKPEKSLELTLLVVFSNRNLEITRANGDRANNGFSGEATNLLRSLINNRQIGISAVEAASPQLRFYRDGLAQQPGPDCSVLGNRTNLAARIEPKVRHEFIKTTVSAFSHSAVDRFPIYPDCRSISKMQSRRDFD